MTARYIEYYEVQDVWKGNVDTLEYFYMPVDNDAGNKENIDNKSLHIWRLDTKRDTVIETYARKGQSKLLTRIQFLKIQLEAKPVPYSQFYLYKKRKEEKEKNG
jgi:hypothetical protein